MNAFVTYKVRHREKSSHQEKKMGMNAFVAYEECGVILKILRLFYFFISAFFKIKLYSSASSLIALSRPEEPP